VADAALDLEDDLLPPRPYPGLRPFEPDEALIFFGRERMAADIITRMLTDDMVVIHGSSGCGKSSLIRAGVLEQFRSRQKRAGKRVETVIMHPGGDALAALANGLIATLGDDSSMAVRRALATGTAARPAMQALMEALEIDTLVILVDQFEELFRFAASGRTGPDTLFVRLILALAGQDRVPVEAVPERGDRAEPERRISVMLTMRSEFLGDCSALPRLAEAINRTQYLLPDMRPEDLLRAVVKPAEIYGGRVEPALARTMVDHAALETDSLPLIQHALMRLWMVSADEGHVLSEDAYLMAARAARSPESKDNPTDPLADEPTPAKPRFETPLSAILAAHADGICDALAPAERDAVGLLFRALTSIDAKGRATRAPAKLKALPGICRASEETIAKLIDTFGREDVAFLKREGTAGPDQYVDISHEALIRAWPRVADAAIDPATGQPRGWLWQEFEDSVIWRALATQARAFAKDPEACLDPATSRLRIPWFDTFVLPRPDWTLRHMDRPKEDVAAVDQPEWQRVSEMIEASRIRWKEYQLKKEHELAEATARADAETKAKERKAAQLRVGAILLTIVSLIGIIGIGVAMRLDERLTKKDAAFITAKAINEDEKASSRSSALNAVDSAVAEQARQQPDESGQSGQEISTSLGALVAASTGESTITSANQGEGYLWVGYINRQGQPTNNVNDLDGSDADLPGIRKGDQLVMTANVVVRSGYPVNGRSAPSIGLLTPGARIGVLDVRPVERDSGTQYWLKVNLKPDARSAPTPIDPRQIKIFPQYTGSETIAETMRSLLGDMGYRIQPLDNETAALGYREIRYCYPQDEQAARQAALAAETALAKAGSGGPVSVRLLPRSLNCSAKTKNGTIELWVDLNDK
jgi:hypothetical protein